MIRRREFMVGLGAAVWPSAAPAQEPALPVIGLVHGATVETYVPDAAGFARGLKEAGFVEAQNLAIEYRFANGRPDQLAALADDLVSRGVALIVTGGDARAAVAAKRATATIPIVFVIGCDPVKLGLAASLDHPGGNATGATFPTAGLMMRKLALLREIMPRAGRVGYLAEDPQVYGAVAAMAREIEDLKSEIRAAADSLGWQVVVAEVGGDRDYESAFAMFAERRADALVVAPSAVFANDSDDIVAMAEVHELATICPRRADVVAGGLMSYGPPQAEAWRQGGLYAGQILAGAAPADLPVMPSTRLELAINRGTAKLLGLEIPPTLLARADEVIE
jgi:putative tryptophan/tyrosine transport system substrate-binding protein